MTSLRFIGDLPWWQGVLLALAVGGLSWWLYWRETRTLGGVAAWMLPTLRGLTIALVLLILSAPVLHHRYREGEPGRLRILIDASQSMAITDQQMEVSAKRRIAASLGWLPSEQSSSTPTSADESPSPPSGQAASAVASVPTDENLQRFDESTRMMRVLERLLATGGSGVLGQLRDEFEIVVERFDSERSKVWESTLEKTTPLPNDPRSWLPEKPGKATALGTALAATAGDLAPQAADLDTVEQSSRQSTLSDQAADETIVLLSDGRNTLGPSALTIAENLATQRRAVMAIGIGGLQAPADIALVSIEHPERVFEKDMLRGTLVVRERMPQAVPLRISIKVLGSDEPLWEETRTLASGERGRVDFAFPVKPVVEKIMQQAGRATTWTSVPLHLVADIAPEAGEADVSNNQRAFHVSVITKRSRLLLIDGRSRWETRYLHNMFDRDPAWQVDLVLPDYRESPPRLPRGTESNQFPSTKERLMEYDLVILGEVPPGVMPRETIDWLKAFVETSGGGLIVVDGMRGALRDASFGPIQSMLPVEWIEDKRIKPDPVSIRLTSTARQLAAFLLTPNEAAKNDAAWSQLPPLHAVAPVKALPGGEVLASYTLEGEEMPVMVTRQYGAGRVFYSATDETWRWRYKVADTYHQRFWNQVARWVMRLPMSVQGPFVAIDSGKLVYQPGEPITLRSRLRGAKGEPAQGLAVEAVITETTVAGLPPQNAATADHTKVAPRVVAVVPLAAEPAIAGVYSGQINAPAAGGNYQVSIVAPGLTSDALAVYSQFSVLEPDSGEMDQLSCDENLLRKVAEVTGGQYLPEERGHELVDLLRPLSRGKIVQSETLLWQSYWWFVPIVVLLSIEWWIRKRVGLI